MSVATLWHWFVTEEAARYSPPQIAIVEEAAADEELLALLASAPDTCQFPLMTLASVHDLVLAGKLPALPAVHAGEQPPTAAAPMFRAA